MAASRWLVRRAAHYTTSHRRPSRKSREQRLKKSRVETPTINDPFNRHIFYGSEPREVFAIFTKCVNKFAEEILVETVNP